MKTPLPFICFFLSLGLLKSSQTPLLSTNPTYYYDLCAPSTCSNFTLSYPFNLPTPCHLPASTLQPFCPTNESLLLTTSISSDTFRVLSLDSQDPTFTSLRIASNSLFTCGAQVSSPKYWNSDSVFSLPLTYRYGTHFNCTGPIPSDSFPGLQNASCLGCQGQDSSRFCYYAPWLVSYAGCETFFIYTLGGVFNASAFPDLRSYLQSGFDLRYDKPVECLQCEDTGGRCGSNPSSASNEFVCFCPSGMHSANCSDGMSASGSQQGRSGLSRAVIAAISASASVLLFAVVVTFVWMLVLRRNQNIHFNNDTLSSISLKRYSYSQLKKFTNNFALRLGEGGFGSVYKGTIHRSGVEVLVAVKILKESKQTKKQFMNEIATIGSVHHHNLVGMLGYCADGHTHGLVYEFMQNKSLDEYIYDGNKKLSTKQVYNIALGTARGILYLHEGCRDRILHCDIKPPNVLLDYNFSAKVADFGFARMIDKDQSHVSLTTAQGTPGYAAPEMWLKTFGPVTVKSDVYSYGMLLLEMVGRRKNYSPQVVDPSEVYFPEWLYNKIEKDEFPFLNTSSGVDEQNGYEEEEGKLNKRMCLVGLWCIQYIPSNRPSMDRVVHMLEGHVEIGVPTHPFPENIIRSHKTTHRDSVV